MKIIAENTPFNVAILFEEPAINDLFAELITARGVKTRIVNRGEEVAASDRVITEPQFLEEIPEAIQETCLVIGNKEALQNSRGIKLSRPLTESKILEALDKFLS